MAKTKGCEKTGGRQKGTQNKRSSTVVEIAERLGVDPFEVLMMIVANDWEGLGYDSPEVMKVVAGGASYHEDRISLRDRLDAAKDAARYLYSQKKSIEITGDAENPVAFAFHDYTTKNK